MDLKNIVMEKGNPYTETISRRNFEFAVEDITVSGKGLGELLLFLHHARERSQVIRFASNLAKKYGSLVALTILDDEFGERLIFDGEFEYRREFVVV